VPARAAQTRPVKIQFKPAVLPRDLHALLAFDAKVFRKPDRFDSAYWRTCRSYWMLLDGVRMGCCAFEAWPGTLYIVTTGILPRYQGQGFGELLKRWEIDYARSHGLHRIVTNTRKSNTRMIDLNHKFGFRITRIEPGYYARPPEATVVMELDLK
jgi:ribosomal protein S18 acetylase RimI-like enzyme